MSVKNRKELRDARHVRLRKRIEGDATRPRLAVYRSIKHIYAQIIDDTTGTTLVAAGTQDKGFEGSGNTEGALKVGEALASRAKEKGIESVVFDRGGNRFHGRVASLAEGARKGGLKF